MTIIRTRCTYLKFSFLAFGMMLTMGSCLKDLEFMDDIDSFDNQKNTDILRVGATIISFVPASGTYYPGDSATSELTFRNIGIETWTFWVGCSVQDKCGVWYDIPSNPVTLRPGQTSPVQRKSWKVPTDSKITSGSYSIRMAVWKYQPEKDLAIPFRLSWRERKSAFLAYNFIDNFTFFNSSVWTKPTHKTPGGLGWFRPENVSIADGQLAFRFPANTRHGGEIQSQNSHLYTYGTFRAKIMCPILPGTITTLFSYQGVDFGDEIDIEIWNDGSKKVGFTVWKLEISSITKEPVYNHTILLDFDPSSGFHEYRIDFFPDRISWYIDGIVRDKIYANEIFPTHAMYLMANIWWPNWAGWDIYKPVSTDRFAYFDGIQH